MVCARWGHPAVGRQTCGGSGASGEGPRTAKVAKHAACTVEGMAFTRWKGLVGLALAACGGTTAQPSSGTDAGADVRGDASSGDDLSDSAVAETSADAPADAAYLACMSASGQLDGSLVTCQSDGDCVIEQEQTNCCGTILYVGIRAASASAFAVCESAWVAHFPGCGCDSGLSTTQDGKTVGSGADASAPRVHCADFTMTGGTCLTYLP